MIEYTRTTTETLRVTTDGIESLCERLGAAGWRVALLSGGAVCVWRPDGDAVIEHRAGTWAAALQEVVRWLR